MNVAKGKWFLFADCDDYYNCFFLNVLDSYKDTNAEVVYFNADYKDGENGKDLGRLPFLEIIDKYDGSEASNESIKFKNNVPWTKMVSKEFIMKYKIFFEETPNGNDILFSLLVGYFVKKFKVEKERLYVYLKNSGSLVTSKNSPSSDRICRIRHVFRRNAFLHYIGHKEWTISPYRQLLHEICNCNLKVRKDLLIDFVWNLRSMYKEQSDWISLIEERRSMNEKI